MFMQLGTFNDLDHHQVASVVSCFVPCEKSSEQIRLRNELSKPMTQLQEAARKIAEVHGCIITVLPSSQSLYFIGISDASFLFRCNGNANWT
jgi:superfamily II RNA helicase